MRLALALIFGCSGEPRLVDDFQLIANDDWGYQLYRQQGHDRVGLVAHGDCTPTHYDALDDRTRAGERLLLIHSGPQEDRRILADADVLAPILVDDTNTVWPDLGVDRANVIVWVETAGWTITDVEELDDGCPLPEPDASPLTYVDDAASILGEKCMVCHWDQGVAPFSIDEYEEILGDTPMMREVLRTRRMPPWNVDPLVGHWESDLSLSSEERATLIRWIEQGAPRGEGPDPLTTYVPSSRDGRERPTDRILKAEPDHLITAAEQEIPATGLLPYRYFDLGSFEEDLWLSGIEIEVGNRKVVHHACLILTPKSPEEYGSRNALRKAVHVDDDVDRTHFWTPGKPTRKNYPEGHAFLLPAGSHLILEIHYNPSGRPETDQTRIGLFEYDEDEPPRRMQVHYAQSRRFVIPSHAQDFEVVHTETLEQDMKLTAANVHLHYRGRSARLVATHPDGQEETLISVPHYDFNWQRGYHMVEPTMLEAGTTLTLTGRFDNSEYNPLNPEPTRWVPWGPQTPLNEMFKAGLEFTPVGDPLD